MISEHIDNNGEFQSDKFGEWCLANFVPLKVSDPMAQPVLFAYAKERAVKDTQFSNDLVWALAIKGYGPAMDAVKMVDGEPTQMPFVVMRPDPHATTGGVVWLPGPHPMPFPESSK